MHSAYLMMHPEREDRQAIAERIASLLRAEDMIIDAEPRLKEALDGQVKFDAVSAPDFVIAVGGRRYVSDGGTNSASDGYPRAWRQYWTHRISD